MPFTLVVNDNFDREDDGYDQGTYATAEEAVAAAVKVIDKSLRSIWKDGKAKDAAALYDAWLLAGAGAAVFPNAGFDGRAYARQRAGEIAQ